jgi:hypothetical protein
LDHRLAPQFLTAGAVRSFDKWRLVADLLKYGLGEAASMLQLQFGIVGSKVVTLAGLPAEYESMCDRGATILQNALDDANYAAACELLQELYELEETRVLERMRGIFWAQANDATQSTGLPQRFVELFDLVANRGDQYHRGINSMVTKRASFREGVFRKALRVITSKWEKWKADTAAKQQEAQSKQMDYQQNIKTAQELVISSIKAIQAVSFHFKEAANDYLKSLDSVLESAEPAVRHDVCGKDKFNQQIKENFRDEGVSGGEVLVKPCNHGYGTQSLCKDWSAINVVVALPSAAEVQSRGVSRVRSSSLTSK